MLCADRFFSRKNRINMLNGYMIIVLLMAVAIAFFTMKTLVNFIVKIIHEARKAFQLMLTVCTVIFLSALMVAPEETGALVGVVMDIFRYLFLGGVKVLRALTN